MQVTRRTPKRALDVEPSEFEVGQRPSPLKQMRAEDPMPAPERRSERARSSNNSRYTFSSPIAKDRPASLLSEAPDRFRHIEPDESMLQYEQEERASVAPSQRAAASDRSTASHETPRKSHGLSIPAISSSRNSGSAHHEGERPAIAAVQQGMLGRKGATTGSSPSVFFDPRTHGGRPLLLGSDGG